MAKQKSPGLFISDAEISAVVGDRASEALAGLNTNPDTQHKATMPAGKRSRREVERWLEANGFNSANDRNF